MNSSSRFLALLAPVCSSFSGVNQGTHKRDCFLPWGDVTMPSVRLGNCLMSRAILLACLADCLGGTFILEQPASSRITIYPRFEWLVAKSRFIFRVGWWARHYGALTPKRHRAWSNTCAVGVLDRGRLSRAQREGCKVETTTKTVSRHGKKGYCGNKFLKGTQPLAKRNFPNHLEVLSYSIWSPPAKVLAAFHARRVSSGHVPSIGV